MEFEQDVHNGNIVVFVVGGQYDDVGKYVGASGMVTNIDDAVVVRKATQEEIEYIEESR